VDQEEQARRPDPELKLHQRGWIGLVGLLLALVLVALLAQKVLKSYGLLSGMEQGTRSDTGLRGPGATSLAPIDPTGATPTPAAAIERVRGVESTIQQQAQDMNKRIDDQAK
jgi:hypothetical protein